MLKLTKHLFSFILIFLITGAIISCKEEPEQEPDDLGLLQLKSIRLGTLDLDATELTEDAPFDKGLVIEFADQLERNSAEENISISTEEGDVDLNFSYLNEDKTISALPENDFQNNTIYAVTLGAILSTNNKEFPGATYRFKTEQGEFKLISAEVDGISLQSSSRIQDVSLIPQIILEFDQNLSPETNFDNFITLTNKGARLPLNFSLSEDQKYYKSKAKKKLETW